MTVTREFLLDMLPTGAFVPESFDWTIGKNGPAIEASVGISEARFLELAIPAAAFRVNTDCWQVATEQRAGTGNVRLARAMGPDEDAAYIRLMGQLDVLRLLSAPDAWVTTCLHSPA